MKHIIGLLAMLLPILSAAQNFNVKTFTVGETVPDLEFKDIRNYEAKSVRLSDIDKKLIILDFWSITCLSCLAQFPRMDTLQQQFNDDIQVFLVNFEGGIKKPEYLEKAKDFVKNWDERYQQPISLPVVFNQGTALRKIFPFIYLPHYIWLNKNREVVAITTSKEVTATNIQAVINSENLDLPLKVDPIF